MGGLFFRKKRLKVSLGKESRVIEVVNLPFWCEGIGLMFKKKEKARALLFSYSFSSRMTIFSYFVKFDFLTIWLNKENNCLELNVLGPNKELKPKKKFRKLVEVPINKNYKPFVEFILKNKDKNLKFNFIDGKI